MRQLKYLMVMSGLLLNVAVATAADESWTAIMCNPAPNCMGDCRPTAMVRSQSAAIPLGCRQMGIFPSYDFARRNADSFNGKPPAAGSVESFDRYFSEGERYRKLGDGLSSRQMYQKAASQAAVMDEALLVGEALLAVGDVQGGIDALTRARDLSSRKIQYSMVGDAFKKADRLDQAQICYDRARNATQ